MAQEATIILRCDANSKIGYGHLSRSIALYEILSLNFRCILATSENHLSTIIPDTINVVKIPIKLKPTEEGHWLLNNISKNIVIITDGYQFNQIYQQHIKRLFIPLIAIDDIAAHHQYADVVVNHAPQIKAENYSTEKYTELALGCRYAMLRSVFYNAHQPSIINAQLKNIFISFGGSDQTEICINAIKGLTTYRTDISIHVLVGNEEISKRIENAFDRNISLNTHYGLAATEVFELIRQSELCIVSSSTIMLEVAAVGKPMLVGYFVDNQHFMYNGAIESGLAHGIGNLLDFDFNSIPDKLALFQSSLFCEKMVDSQRSNFQFPIKNNLTTLIKSLITELKFVSATTADGHLLLDWRNDPTTIANSIVSEAVNPETHHKWLATILNDSNVELFIVTSGNEAIGTVRINSTEPEKEISWTIAPSYRGKGYGKTIVTKLVCSLEGTIVAQIKSGNIASKKIAEYAGLKMVSETNGLVNFELKTSQ